MNSDKKRTSLVLMELIIAILFFSIVSAFCAKIFLTAHLESESNRKLAEAVIECQTAMELILADDGKTDELAKIYPDIFLSDNIYNIPVNETDYILAKITFAGNMAVIKLDYYSDNNLCFYSIESQKYIGGVAYEQ